MCRYSIHADGNIVIVEGLQARKEAIIDCILIWADGEYVRVEHYPAPYVNAPCVLDRWHVFAHDGYHMIEVVEIT